MKNWLPDVWARFKGDVVNAHKSLTIWFNGIMGAAVVALPIAQDNFAQLQDYLPANPYHSMMGAVVVGNIILRFKTNGALAEK